MSRSIIAGGTAPGLERGHSCTQQVVDHHTLVHMGVGSSLVFRTCSCSASQPVGVTAPRVIGRKAAGRREGGGAGEEALEERGAEGGESSAVCAPTVPSAAAGAVAEMRRRRRRRRWRRWREGEAWKSMMWHPVCLAVVADQGTVQR